MKFNRVVSLGLTLVAALSLASCGSSPQKTEKAKDATTTKASSKKAESAVSVPSDDKGDWFFKKDIYYAGMETYKLTKSEIRDSAEDGKKVLVIYMDITNNSKKEQDPSNIYMVVHAYQKNETSDVQLDPGAVALDDNGNNPLQQYEDGLHNKLLPGKTVTGVIEFALKNTNQVTVKFDNADMNTIGSKTYDVN
jgi:hypothetical protein